MYKHALGPLKHGHVCGCVCQISIGVTLAQDYARLHGYPIVATAIVADPTLPNSWNKIGWLLRAYRVPPYDCTSVARSACPEGV